MPAEKVDCMVMGELNFAGEREMSVLSGQHQSGGL